MILNNKNFKVYIGSSKDISSRWTSHKRELKNGTHINKYLQASYNKYGSHSFAFSILEFCEEEDLQEKEEYWCVKYDSHNPDKGYNLASIKRNGAFSEEYIKNCSDACWTKKEVIKTDFEGNILIEYPSIMDLSKTLGISRKNATNLVKGWQYKAYKGFLYFIKEDFNEELLKERIPQENKLPKKVYQWTLEKEFIKEFKSQKNAIEETKIVTLIDCLHGKQKQAGGFLWTHTNTPPTFEKKYIYQYDLEKNLKNKFENYNQLEELGFKRKGISKCMYGEVKTYKGYIFSRNLL